MSATVVWFRQDLRLADNAALHAAVDRGKPLIALYIEPSGQPGEFARGSANALWLEASLAALDQSLEKLGSRLLVSNRSATDTFAALRRDCGVDAVYWNRRYEPDAIEHDTEVKRELGAEGFEAESFPGNVLVEPWQMSNRQGLPYRVFTPFYRVCAALPLPALRDAPRSIPPPPDSMPGALGGTPAGPKLSGWRKRVLSGWTPGERGAEAGLATFADDAVLDYPTGRDRPGRDGTSKLSPHLHFGELSPARVIAHIVSATDDAESASAFTRQIYWREFAQHLLYHFPHTARSALVERFDAFPWQPDPQLLAVWQRGETGYPLVDAGMRELWQTGWMHNRVRMNVASFAVKHLLQPWQSGAAWFWDTLLDADLANNSLGWQWAAGCGADAAPYFRIFNPTLQSRKFDPAGDYIRRFVPALAKLPATHIHAPHEAPEEVLAKAGVVLDENYPRPVIEHRTARQRALDALASLRSDSAPG